MQIPVYNTKGKEVESWKIADKSFGAENPTILAQAVRVYTSNSHQKTSKVKTLFPFFFFIEFGLAKASSVRYSNRHPVKKEKNKQQSNRCCQRLRSLKMRHDHSRFVMVEFEMVGLIDWLSFAKPRLFLMFLEYHKSHRKT